MCEVYVCVGIYVWCMCVWYVCGMYCVCGVYCVWCVCMVYVCVECVCGVC